MEQNEQYGRNRAVQRGLDQSGKEATHGNPGEPAAGELETLVVAWEPRHDQAASTQIEKLIVIQEARAGYSLSVDQFVARI